MKITMYELLGMAKDGIAPKKIKYMGYNFEYITNHKRYERYAYEQIITLNDFVNVDNNLNDEVEIIEEEKKIPEKLDHLIGYDIQQFDDLKEYVEITTNDLFGKINKVIDTLNQLSDYLKSKGE
jgi:hypothetical protein